MNWRISVTWLALTAAACGTAPAPGPAGGQTADLVIVNGRVFVGTATGVAVFTRNGRAAPKGCTSCHRL